jgi:hypothetical protein
MRGMTAAFGIVSLQVCDIGICQKSVNQPLDLAAVDEIRVEHFASIAEGA